MRDSHRGSRTPGGARRRRPGRPAAGRRHEEEVDGFVDDGAAPEVDERTVHEIRGVESRERVDLEIDSLPEGERRPPVLRGQRGREGADGDALWKITDVGELARVPSVDEDQAVALIKRPRRDICGGELAEFVRCRRQVLEAGEAPGFLLRCRQFGGGKGAASLEAQVEDRLGLALDAADLGDESVDEGLSGGDGLTHDRVLRPRPRPARSRASRSPGLRAGGQARGRRNGRSCRPSARGRSPGRCS